jgi:hypothetical protein
MNMDQQPDDYVPELVAQVFALELLLARFFSDVAQAQPDPADAIAATFGEIESRFTGGGLDSTEDGLRLQTLVLGHLDRIRRMIINGRI